VPSNADASPDRQLWGPTKAATWRMLGFKPESSSRYWTMSSRYSMKIKLPNCEQPAGLCLFSLYSETWENPPLGCSVSLPGPRSETDRLGQFSALGSHERVFLYEDAIQAWMGALRPHTAMQKTASSGLPRASVAHAVKRRTFSLFAKSSPSIRDTQLDL
jgi:hypothetical protein